MKIDGQCHCGEIAFEAELDPQKVGVCHCTDCQSLSASAFRTVAIVPASSFRITRGEPREYVKFGDSGNRRAQAFCKNCGSAIYAASADGERSAYNIRLGTVKQRHMITPRFECWHGSALPWVSEIPGTRKFDKNPS